MTGIARIAGRIRVAGNGQHAELANQRGFDKVSVGAVEGNLIAPQLELIYQVGREHLRIADHEIVLLAGRISRIGKKDSAREGIRLLIGITKIQAALCR